MNTNRITKDFSYIACHSQASPEVHKFQMAVNYLKADGYVVNSTPETQEIKNRVIEDEFFNEDLKGQAYFFFKQGDNSNVYIAVIFSDHGMVNDDNEILIFQQKDSELKEIVLCEGFTVAQFLERKVTASTNALNLQLN